MPYFQAQSLSVEVQAGSLAVLWLDVPDRTHNVFNRQVLADIEAALERVSADGKLTLLAILSRKPAGFIAGADLHEFTRIHNAEEAQQLSAAGQKLFDKLARLRIPTLAVIHGPCLGGGLECALACDYRIVVDQPGTRLGLPEIKLGLIPGWGGTQRLPRRIGIERAVQVILQSRELGAVDALRWGLVDAVAPTQHDAMTLVEGQFRQRGKPSGDKRSPRGWRQRLLEANPLGRWLLFRGIERIVRRRSPDDMPAPLEAVRAIRTGLREGMAAGLAYEREAIGRLATTPACRNLITVFFLMENAKKINAPEDSLRRIGVVGAGTMGAGIAQLAAIKGCEVVVREINDAALAAGMLKIEALFQKAVERRVLSAEEARRKLAAIGGTTSWVGFANVDLVIEAAIEDLDTKREVFRELERHTRPGTILATNTSSLLVKQLQEGMQHPQFVGGLHFFNPVHKMPLVEVVRAPGTEDKTASSLARWAARVGKIPVIVRDSAGFVVNRMLMPYLNEAVLLLAQGMPPEQIDHVMRRFGMPMGPLELLDQVGLDIAAHIARTMQPHFGDRFMPNAVFEQMCRKGWLGQKNGAGFYLHQGKKLTVNPGAVTLVRAAEPKDEFLGPRPSIEELDLMRDRMVLLMVNEAVACLFEGVADRADVIDLAMILGTGWAPHRGGPLRYADDRGATDVVRTLDNLAQRINRRFEPCSELRRRAQNKDPFYGQLALSQVV